MRCSHLLVAPLVLAGCTSPPSAAPPAARLEVGSLAPDLSLPGSDGKTHTLAENRGVRPVVLAWFPKAFSEDSTRECKSIRESGEKIRQFDVAYFAVSVDPPDKNRQFAESLGADYPILSDASRAVARAYGVLDPKEYVALRSTFYIGVDGKIARIDRDVNSVTAGADLVLTLRELAFPVFPVVPPGSDAGH